MFSKEEYERMNQESQELDQKFTKLPPQEVISCLTAYTIVYHTAMAAKAVEEMKETNMLLEELLFAISDLKGERGVDSRLQDDSSTQNETFEED